MNRFLTILSLAALLAAPAAQAQARPHRAPAKARPIATAQVQPNAAVRARQNAMNDFGARMGRLDALMGVPTMTATRSRSAEAGR